MTKDEALKTMDLNPKQYRLCQRTLKSGHIIQTEALKMAIEADDYDLAEVLNDPLTSYPLNFSTPKKANALLFALCQAGADEILRLRRALEEALEQPAQEPVGYFVQCEYAKNRTGLFYAFRDTLESAENLAGALFKFKNVKIIRAYTKLNDEYLRDTHVEGLQPAPPCQECENLKHDLEGYMEANKVLINREWQGLSDDEIKNIWFKVEHEIAENIVYGAKLARAIEQALKEKNNV